MSPANGLSMYLHFSFTYTPSNIWLMFVTLETFHSLMPPLNSLPLNKSLMSVMSETSISFKSHSGPSV